MLGSRVRLPFHQVIRYRNISVLILVKSALLHTLWNFHRVRSCEWAWLCVSAQIEATEKPLRRGAF
jgi:hypothetical protein